MLFVVAAVVIVGAVVSGGVGRRGHSSGPARNVHHGITAAVGARSEGEVVAAAGDGGMSSSAAAGVKSGAEAGGDGEVDCMCCRLQEA